MLVVYWFVDHILAIKCFYIIALIFFCSLWLFCGSKPSYDFYRRPFPISLLISIFSTIYSNFYFCFPSFYVIFFYYFFSSFYSITILLFSYTTIGFDGVHTVENELLFVNFYSLGDELRFFLIGGLESIVVNFDGVFNGFFILSIWFLFTKFDYIRKSTISVYDGNPS